MPVLNINKSSAPVLITPGDPAGIGPEITLKAIAAGLRGVIVMGQISHLELLAEHMALPLRFRAVSADDIDACDDKNLCSVLPVNWTDMPAAGQPNQRNAQAVISAIADAVALAQSGAVSAIVTNPISKSVLYEAGFEYPGHTEYLAALDKAPLPVMMLANPHLKAVPVTIHIPLQDVSEALTPQLLRQTIEIIHNEMQQRFGLSAPRIAIAGLNPHAGEGGHIGREESQMVTPLLSALRDEGLNVSGPHSADTLFHPEARTEYDVVVAMYHDQALIPVKTLDFYGSVNVTLGLSFIRTSPDHGTAFDRAGHFLAREDSLKAAVQMAQDMADYQLHYQQDSSQ